MTGELYLCAHVRQFSAQASLRLRPELQVKPVAVIEGDPPFQRVCSFNKHARTMGVAAGMGRAEMDSFPSVALLKRSAAEERAAMSALLESAGRFSPRIEVIGGDNVFECVLDIDGTEKLFGPPSTIAMRVQQAFSMLDITCSIAINSNFHAAICLARGAASTTLPVIVPAGEERQALSYLPLDVIEAAAEVIETLTHWGVTTLGMLARLPENDLISRLGQQAKRLRELARGECPHLFLPVEPVLALEEYIELDSPVEVLDSLLFGVGRMVEQLIARAAARVLSLAVVVAELELEDGAVHSRAVRPALPSNDKQLWLKLLHLDWIAHPPTAAVVSLRLQAETGQAGNVQLGLFSPQLPEPGRLDVTLARIHAIVGEDRAGSVKLEDTHRPGSFQITPFSLVSSATGKGSEPRRTATAMRCLRPAEKVAVTLSGHNPRLFYFRGIAYRVERTYGPWRNAGGWWTDRQWSVEEWDIVACVQDKRLRDNAGGLLCCCMTHNLSGGRWQIEALYD